MTYNILNNYKGRGVRGTVGSPFYTEEEINKYLNILNNYKGRGVRGTVGSPYKKAQCSNCLNTVNFTIDFGHKICDECGTINGCVLGLFDLKDYDRLHYRKKSIYQRKYHYEKKVNQISKLINLNDEQKCELYDRLLKIDNHIMSLINKQYFRKRMININYLTKKLLEEMGCEKYKLIILKISPQTLEIYEKWWASYKSLKK